MTRDEAISVLKITSVNLGRRGGRTAYVEALEMAIEALEMAIEALRAQDVPNTNVGDTIYRQAAIDIVEFECGEWRGLARTIVEAIEQLHSAQPETAKRIVGKSRDGMTLWYQCDMCNEPVDAQDNFCRGCGRRLTDG